MQQVALGEQKPDAFDFYDSYATLHKDGQKTKSFAKFEVGIFWTKITKELTSHHFLKTQFAIKTQLRYRA